MLRSWKPPQSEADRQAKAERAKERKKKKKDKKEVKSEDGSDDDDEPKQRPAQKHGYFQNFNFVCMSIGSCFGMCMVPV